ncbi:hypothetical protein SESBI_40432 [Sesbania bispinosa]|nr:hypothetical protein SESBI_40432 [Sesbania bispinosa]
MSSLKLEKDEDPCQRSTKKVKIKDHSEVVVDVEYMDVAYSNGGKEEIPRVPPGAYSYKEKLLQSPGSPVEGNNHVFYGVLPEDWWYQQEEDNQDDSFDPCPKIELSQEEFDDMCKPWRGSLHETHGEKDLPLSGC